MKRIILTGGGTAGHVTPNIALIPKLQKEGWDIHYIGTHGGIEKTLIESTGIPYHGISSGKLRRYFDIKNFTDPFRVVKGVGDATGIVRKLKPNVIFSKGGFVAVPVIMGGWLGKVPVIIHESDMTPGLANKISIPFANKVCANFPETMEHLPSRKGVLTGTPIRKELFQGEATIGFRFCGFTSQKPVLMVMGGSLGSIKINTCLRKALPHLLQKFQVVHLCGKGNKDKSLENLTGYRQYEYIQEELPHIFAMSHMVISRAGANSIFEILTLQKPNLLIPLSAKASRGDQILNANSFAKQGFSKVLIEEEMTVDTLIQSIEGVYAEQQNYKMNMKNSKLQNGVEAVMNLIREYA